MALYALVDPTNLINRYDANVDPSVKTKTGWRWLIVVDTNPDYNSATQVKTGPVITINQTNVTRVWTVRDKTAGELDDDKTENVTSSFNTIIGKVLFNHENRIRALEGKAAITAAQFITAIKALV